MIKLELSKDEKLWHHFAPIFGSQRIPTTTTTTTQTTTRLHEVQVLRLVGNVLDVNWGSAVTLEGADRRHDDGALEE